MEGRDVLLWGPQHKVWLGPGSKCCMEQWGEGSLHYTGAVGKEIPPVL